MAIDDNGVNVKVTAENNTQQGFEQVKQGARNMAQSVATEAGKASKAVDNIGNGGAASSKKVESATRSMIQSIQRTTAAMEAGSRSSSQYYEALAGQRGVDVNVLRPYLAQLEAIEQKQKQASSAMTAGAATMGKVGISAAQTAAAMRQVPAQMTDIVVSLQAGQAPMTVLLQQGGQLKDAFGGIAPAARALGSSVMGLINPFTVAAAAAGALYLAYRSGAAESEEFNRTLILTGNTIGLTAGQMQDMAQRIDGVVGTQRSASAAINEFARSSKVGSDSLESFAASALRWEEATGTAVADTAKQFSDLAKDPLAASLKLNESMGHLTASVYSQIKALEDQGRQTEAAAVAQKAFADAMDERSPRMLEQTGSLARGWNAVKKAVQEAVDAIAGVGRASTNEEAIRSQTITVTSLRKQIDALREHGRPVSGQLLASLDAAQGRLDDLQREYMQTATAAGVAKKAQEELARAVSVDNYLGSTSRMSRAQQMEKDIAAEQNAYKQAVQNAQGNAEKLQKIEQAHQVAMEEIRDRYKDKGGKPKKTEAERELERQRKAELKAIEDFEKERIKLIDSQRAEIVAIDEKARRLEDENRLYGMSKTAIDELHISRLEEQAAMLAGFSGSEQQVALINKEIEARKRLLTATSEREVLDANKKAADEAVRQQERAAEESLREWERITDQIGQSLTDALMDGGRSAKDMLQDLFRTMVLRPLLQPAVNGVAGAIGGAMGIPGAPNSGLSSGGGIMGAASNLKTLYTGITGGLTASIASGVSAIGSAIGSSAVQSFALGMKGNALAAGLAGPTTAGAGGAMGAGAMFASAMPWLAGGVALYSLLGDKFKGETRFGGSYYVGDLADGTKSYLSERPTATRAVYEGGPSGGDPAADQAKQLMVSTYASLTDAAKTLGGSLEDLALFGSWEVSPEKGNSFVRTIVAGAEGDLYNQKLDLKGVKDSEEVFAAFQAELPKLIIAALQQVDLDDAFDSYLDQINIGALDEAGVQAVLANLNAMVQFRDALASLPFEELAGLSLQAGLNMAEFSGGMDALLANMQTYYGAFYSQEEQLANLRSNIARSLDGIGVAMPATNAEFRAIVESLDVTTEKGQQAYATMMGLAGSFNELTTGMDQMAQAAEQAAEAQRQAAQRALEDAQRAAYDAAVAARQAAEQGASDAMSILSNAVNARKEELQRAFDQVSEGLRTAITASQSTLSNLQSLATRLQSTLFTMRGQTDAAMNRAAAQAQIERSLSVARLTGVMPGGQNFENALQVVAQPSEQLFGSFEEYQMDFLRTANNINQLNELTGTQISVEEQTLAALQDQLKSAEEMFEEEMAKYDEMLELAQSQLEETLGTKLAVMSVEGAIANLASAIATLKSTPVPGTPSEAIKGGYINDLYRQAFGRNAEQAGIDYWTGRIQSGLSVADLERAIREAAQNEDRTRLRGFAVGTNYVPQDMNARIHEGERIIPEADNRELMARLSNPDRTAVLLQELIAENRELREVVRSHLYPIAKNTGKTAATLDRWDVDGQPEAREAVTA